MMFTAAVYSAF